MCKKTKTVMFTIIDIMTNNSQMIKKSMAVMNGDNEEYKEYSNAYVSSVEEAIGAIH